MTLNRYARRKDANQSEIADALERHGFEVWVIDRPADLLTWRPDKGWHVIECKTAKGRLTALQAAEREQGRGKGIILARTPIEALRALGASGYDHER